jgi:acyl-CoA synthetase (AMP-forming)/AMP-acid ligase II
MDCCFKEGGLGWTPDGQPREYFDGLTGELTCDWDPPKHDDDGRQLSLAEAFAVVFERYAGRPCLGARLRDGEYRWLSFASLFAVSRRFAARLAESIPPGTSVGICAANSFEWFVADFACLWAGLVTMPLSESFSVTTMEAVLDKASAGCIICDRFTEQKVLRVACSGRVPGLRHVIVANRDPSAALLWEDARSRAVSVQSFEELLCAETGSPQEATENSHTMHIRRGDEPHTIIYTSGTTGLPKGVVYSDGLWLRNMVHHRFAVAVGFSYMPLAYITDRHTVWTSIWNGGRVGICTHRGNTDIIFRDLKEVKPTVLKGVPAFFEQVLQAVRMVGDTSLQILGGRVHTLICGAGHFSQDAAQYLRVCKTAGAKFTDSGGVEFVGGWQPLVLVGYGSTESGNLACNEILSSHVLWRLQPLDDQGGAGSEEVGVLEVKTGEMIFLLVSSISSSLLRYGIGDLKDGGPLSVHLHQSYQSLESLE